MINEILNRFRNCNGILCYDCPLHIKEYENSYSNIGRGCFYDKSCREEVLKNNEGIEKTIINRYIEWRLLK